jgi:hypothetical protein|tara:strand:+ start:250 stop:525 length:276 start_codon:yes stop_codon:yes gene_type:complete
MIIELRVNVAKIFGVGSMQGGSGTLQRYLSQTDAGSGRIEVSDHGILSLSEAEALLSSHLSTDVSEIANMIGTERNSDPAMGNWINLEIRL